MSEPAIAPPAPVRRALPPPARAVRASFVFLTRLPVGGFPYSDADWAWASAHFPLVGAVLGAALGALDALLLPLGPLPAAAIVLGASLLLTGALHEDGLADTADALGGSMERTRILEILKDTHIGSFGATALGLSLLARAALIARLGPLAPLSLPLVLCAARTAPVWLLWALPYTTEGAAAKSRLVARASNSAAAVATAWLALAAAVSHRLGVISTPRLLALIAAVALVALATGACYARRLGGVTGDFLGATEQLAEIAALATLAWA